MMEYVPEIKIQLTCVFTPIKKISNHPNTTDDQTAQYAREHFSHQHPSTTDLDQSLNCTIISIGGAWYPALIGSADSSVITQIIAEISRGETHKRTIKVSLNGTQEQAQSAAKFITSVYPILFSEQLGRSGTWMIS